MSAPKLWWNVNLKFYQHLNTIYNTTMKEVLIGHTNENEVIYERKWMKMNKKHSFLTPTWVIHAKISFIILPL